MQEDIISNKSTNSLDTDYKAEVVAASLIEQGIDPDRITIIRDGIFRRSVSKEVEEVYQKYSDYKLVDYLYIHANKEGMYDMLPQGLFHQSTYKRTYKDVETDVEKALDEIKIHREQEFFARKFFHLFELIADRTLTDAYLFEAKYDRKTSNSEFTDLFAQYWPILQMLTLKQGVFFMHIIPLLHRIRTHYENIQQALSCILDVPVDISKIKLPAKDADESFESAIGKNHLGVSLVVGNQFDDGEYDLKVTIGPISAETMKGFLKTGKDYNILKNLCDTFLPANTFVVYDFLIDPQDSIFILSNDSNSTYLGINSFI